MVSRVYLADDDDDWLELVTGILQARFGVTEVRGFSDGGTLLAALAAPGAVPPDLVLVDLRMPGVDGFELLRERARQGWTVPVAVLSSGVTPADHASCLAAGAFATVVKPIGYAAIATALQELLAGGARGTSIPS